MSSDRPQMAKVSARGTHTLVKKVRSKTFHTIPNPHVSAASKSYTNKPGPKSLSHAQPSG